MNGIRSILSARRPDQRRSIDVGREYIQFISGPRPAAPASTADAISGGPARPMPTRPARRRSIDASGHPDVELAGCRVVVRHRTADLPGCQASYAEMTAERTVGPPDGLVVTVCS